MVAAAAVVGGLAAAARADRGWAPPAGAGVGPVDVAYGSFAGGIGWTRSTCEGAVLWLPGERQRWLFRVPGPCPATSTGRGVSAVAVSSQRVVFLSYVGGNTREWRLWTATPTAKRPRLLRTASADADAPSPIRARERRRGRNPVRGRTRRVRARQRRAPGAHVARPGRHRLAERALRHRGGDARGRNGPARPRPAVEGGGHVVRAARRPRGAGDQRRGRHRRRRRDLPRARARARSGSTSPRERGSSATATAGSSTRAAARSTSTRTSASRTSWRAPSAPSPS